MFSTNIWNAAQQQSTMDEKDDGTMYNMRSTTTHLCERNWNMIFSTGSKIIVKLFRFEKLSSIYALFVNLVSFCWQLRCMCAHSHTAPLRMNDSAPYLDKHA